MKDFIINTLINGLCLGFVTFIVYILLEKLYHKCTGKGPQKVTQVVPTLSMVEDFQKTFDNPVLDKPTISEDRWELKVELIREELEELKQACIVKDKVEVLDALVDLQYVLNGAILEFGMQEVFPKAFIEVHNSNMSKACGSMDEVIRTQKHYEKQGVDTDFFLHQGQYIVYRLSDDKTLKSVDYTPVNLAKFV